MPARWLPLALVLLAVLALHHRKLTMPFMADDYVFLDHVRRHSFGDLLAVPDPIGNYYRPLSRQLYFWALAHLTGVSASLAHALNLALFAGIILAIHTLGLRLGGLVGAACAAAVVGFHYSWDVLLSWVSGVQDLLAVLGVLVAVMFQLRGASIAAGAAMLLALLAKETAVVALPVLAMLSRRRSEAFSVFARRTAPIAAAFAAWVLLYALALRRGAIQPQVASAPSPQDAIAAIVHALQVVVGLEWEPQSVHSIVQVAPSFIPFVLCVVAVLLPSLPHRKNLSPGANPGDAALSLRVIAVWAFVGAVLVTPVVTTWSAYYYVLPVCAAALALAAAAPHIRQRWLLVALVTLVLWRVDFARALPPPSHRVGAWTPHSHLDAGYFRRAATLTTQLASELRRLYPKMPPRSVFFGSLPPFAGLQVADGPLVRWVYRDTSLRAFYVAEFTAARARAAPFVVLYWVDGRLEQVPENQALQDIALGLLQSERAGPARDALALAVERDPTNPQLRYWLGWATWGAGDSIAAALALRGAGMTLSRGPSPKLAEAGAIAARGDTLAAALLLIETMPSHVLDPEAHFYLAGLCLTRRDLSESGIIELYAARLLDPQRAAVWRTWGLLQFQRGRPGEAFASLSRYLSKDADATHDPVVASVMAALREAGFR